MGRDYTPPFPFGATLHSVTLEVPGVGPVDGATEVAGALRHE